MRGGLGDGDNISLNPEYHGLQTGANAIVSHYFPRARFGLDRPSHGFLIHRILAVHTFFSLTCHKIIGGNVYKARKAWVGRCEIVALRSLRCVVA